MYMQESKRSYKSYKCVKDFLEYVNFTPTAICGPFEGFDVFQINKVKTCVRFSGIYYFHNRELTLGPVLLCKGSFYPQTGTFGKIIKWAVLTVFYDISGVIFHVYLLSQEAQQMNISGIEALSVIFCSCESR